VNGCGGAFEDFLINDIYPFMTSTYSIRPEREAHAILGASAGGYGGMGLALKHREMFASVATIAAPLNMRYDTVGDNYEEDFHPETFRWETEYNPEKIVGRFYCGLYLVRAKKYLEPVFGCTGDVEAAVRATNPADLLTTTDLKPGELSLYVGYGHQDNYNFDAQSASFVWLAEQRGIAVTVQSDPSGKHDLRYFGKAHRLAFVWIGQQFCTPAH
jgi:S-formylglutathione hydrolase FrmB